MIDRINVTDIDNLQLQKAKFKQAPVAWVTCHHILFSMIEDPFFQQMLTIASDNVLALLNTSYNSLHLDTPTDALSRDGPQGCGGKSVESDT